MAAAPNARSKIDTEKYPNPKTNPRENITTAIQTEHSEVFIYLNLVKEEIYDLHSRKGLQQEML